MQAPKMQQRFCNYCRKHTEHDVHRSSTSKQRREMAVGQRSFLRKMKGFGSFPKSNPHDRAKPTKKLSLLYKCKECGKQHTIGLGFRAKKYELVKA